MRPEPIARELAPVLREADAAGAWQRIEAARDRRALRRATLQVGAAMAAIALFLLQLASSVRDTEPSPVVRHAPDAVVALPAARRAADEPPPAPVVAPPIDERLAARELAAARAAIAEGDDARAASRLLRIVRELRESRAAGEAALELGRIHARARRYEAASYAFVDALALGLPTAAQREEARRGPVPPADGRVGVLDEGFAEALRTAHEARIQGARGAADPR